MNIRELEGFPKSLLKKDQIPFYRAFIITNPDDAMHINTSVDILSITMNAAIISLINEKRIVDPSEIKGRIISFAIFEINRYELEKKDIVDEGDVYFKNENISITLKDKQYDIRVEDYILDDITIDIDPTTEYRICSNIKLTRKESE